MFIESWNSVLGGSRGWLKTKSPPFPVWIHKALRCVLAGLGQSRTWLQCCDAATPQDGIYSRERHLCEGEKGKKGTEKQVKEAVVGTEGVTLQKTPQVTSRNELSVFIIK